MVRQNLRKIMMAGELGALVFLCAFILPVFSQDTANKKSFGEINSSAKVVFESEVALVSVPYIEHAPVGDADWSFAQSIRDFKLLGIRELARAQTHVRIYHDKTALYLRIDCEEPLLDPVHNMTEHFIANCQERDNNSIFRDDSIEIFFDPDGLGINYFQLVTNSLGAQWDAKIADVGWNGKWESTGGQTESGWWVKLRIPLKEIGISATGPAGTFNIARNRQPEKEMSTLSVLSDSFLEISRFTAIALTDSAVTTEIRAQHADNTFAGFEYILYNPTTSPVSLKYGFVLRDASQQMGQQSKSIILDAGQRRTVKISESEWSSIDEKWQHARAFVQKHDDLEFLTLSTWQSIGAGKQINAAILIESSAAFDAFHNGQLLELVKSDDALWKGQINLAEGNNTIGVQLKESGHWRMRLYNDDKALNVVSSSAWMTTGKSVNNWTNSDYLPRKPLWSSAVVEDHAVASSGECGPAQWLTGEENSVFLRHITVGRTRYLPEVESKLYPIYKNIGQVAKVFTHNPSAQGLPNYELIIETSPELKLINPVGSLNFHNRSFIPREMKTIELNDKYTRHIIKFDGILVSTARRDVEDILRRNALQFVLLPEGSDKLAMRIYAQAMDGFITEVPSEIQFVKLPFPQGQTIASKDIELWVSDMFTHSEDAWPILLDGYKAAGIKTLCFFRLLGDPYGFERIEKYFVLAKKKGFRISAVIEPSEIQRDWIRNHPEDEVVFSEDYRARIEERGQTWQFGRAIPLEKILDPNHGSYHHWKNKYQQALRDFPVTLDDVHWDHEVPPFLYSFDKLSLAAFRRFAELPESIPLDCRIIKEKYSQEWIDFVCHQRYRQAVEMRKVIKEVLPNATFSMYSGYYPSAANKYSCDWRLMAKVVDVGSGGFFGDFRGTAQETGKILASEGKKFKNGIGFYRSGHAIERGGVLLTKALSDGHYGILIYASNSITFNTTTLEYLARVTQHLPKIEPFLLKNEKRDNYLVTSLPASVWKHEDSYLIAIMNSTGKDQDMKLSWKGPKITAVRSLEGKTRSNRLPSNAKISAFGVSWYVLECEPDASIRSNEL